MQINTAVEIEEKIARARVEYPALWRRLIQQWHAAESGNSAWLMYAANYLFFTGGVRWAIDPFSPATRIKGIPHADYAADLDQLELVLLTHAHNDHLDLNLIRAISGLPIQWIVPEFMLEKVTGAGVPGKNILVPVNGKTIEFKGLGITPFAGQHIHGRYGVPETGYLVECAGKRWLFPGDTRVYEPGTCLILVLWTRFSRMSGWARNARLSPPLPCWRSSASILLAFKADNNPAHTPGRVGTG